MDDRLRMLVGTALWGTIAGEGGGSIVSFLFGAKVRRNRPLKNPALSPELREFDGEYALYVECSWRLDGAEEIITGGWDDNREGGPMLTGLAGLLGRRVERVNVSSPGQDATLHFDDGQVLRVFCDSINLEDAHDNYSLFTPTEIVTVGPRSEVVVERRSD